ncbi:MAG: nucleotide exchange factor GrpE [Candidatus Promineifilaceae bacterium]|nr:nucleotide exchange factor GrpE [Candidatus Promineifilaceae bacterium]
MNEERHEGQEEVQLSPAEVESADVEPAEETGAASETDEAGPALEERLEQAEAQAAEYLDGWQRARAEFANARKRLERERMEAYQRAAVDYAKKLLPILDDFDRALETVPQSLESDSWLEGLLLVRRKLQSILEDLNVEPIETVGQPFDPNFHEALALRDVDGVESGIVVEEMQRGYRLGDRVIRPALVNVAA